MEQQIDEFLQGNLVEEADGDTSSEENEEDRDTDVSDSAILALSGSSQQVRLRRCASVRAHNRCTLLLLW